MDFTPSFNAKQFFRFTGPPENWLTAIKFMTWGLEQKHESWWKKIQPGDVFFIHSTGPQTSFFKNAKSGVIGLGVVGSNFSIKENYLWIKEFQERTNKWPLLIPLSEIYLFSEIQDPSDWPAPSEGNLELMKGLVDQMLKNYMPLSSIKGFPQMGSFSSVSSSVVDQILNDKRPLYVYRAVVEEAITNSKPTALESVKNVSETLRFAGTLKAFDTIKKRVVRETIGNYTKDNELLARAEEAHSTILQQLIDIFRAKGYETRSNKYVDLFAHNESRAFLFEVKSTENDNFRSQARKGLVQLLEYDYFEVNKFIMDYKLVFKDRYRILVPSLVPKDEQYIGFINNLETGVAIVKDDSLNAVGIDFGFSKL